MDKLHEIAKSILVATAIATAIYTLTHLVSAVSQ